MTSIFEGQPPKTSPFPTKTRVIWVPGIHLCLIFPLQKPDLIQVFLGKTCGIWGKNSLLADRKLK